MLFFFKRTQSKSIRKTKFGASQFSPLGKEMERGGRTLGWGQQLVKDVSSLPGGEGRGAAGVCRGGK